MMDEGIKYDECRSCGKQFDESRIVAKCKECQDDLTDCPDSCGEHTVCHKCAAYEGDKCQRCRQPLFQENPPTVWERDSRTEKYRNWMLNWEGESMDMDRDPDWHFRCLECGQLHQEWYGVAGDRVRGSYFVPVNAEGETIECTRIPKIENGFCQDCGNRSEHAENCRFWKAKKELKEAITDE